MSLRELDTAGPPSRALVADVERAATVKAACAAVVEHLARRPGLMPSLYLMRGGRLRCQAVKGYWQVFDGMRPHAGVIGTTFATGIPAVIRSTSTSADYLEAVPTVRSEVCVPIRLENRVIGALNVESEQELGEGLLSVLERCAECVARRIAEVGGLPAETRPERLARHAAELTGLVETEAILERAMDAACDIADMESATVALVSAGTPRLASARGPHAPALRGLAPEQVAMVAEWIRASSSVYTIGEPDGRGFSGHEALRGAGAGALVALPLAAEKGFLLLVDSAPISLETEDIELLELLAAQTSSALATAAAVGELQERAASDPLTGLGHHASFHASLEEACTRRERRGRLALLIVDLDGFKQI
ncbi:MAG: GAF domain-containing protein, partial [Thermoleophilaceae bacterium]